MLRLSVVIVRHVVGPRERGRVSEGRITRGQNGEGGKVLQTHEKSGKRLLVEARLERRRAVRRSRMHRVYGPVHWRGVLFCAAFVS